MLTLTDTASTVVKAIVDQNASTDTAGLRIGSHSQDGTEFGAVVVTAPEPFDQVLEKDGARVYLDEGASAALADKVLDAHADSEGRVEFALTRQAE